MIWWVIGIFSIVFASIVIVAVYFSWRQTKTITTLLEIEARKRSGQVHKKWGTTNLVFPYHGFSIIVHSTFGSDYAPPQTIVSTTIDHTTEERLRVFPRSWFLGRIRRQRISSGNNEFDRLFTIKGVNESLVRNVITVDIQRGMIDLAKLRPEVKIDKTLLSFTIGSIPKTEEEYDHTINILLQMVDHFSSWKKNS